MTVLLCICLLLSLWAPTQSTGCAGTPLFLDGQNVHTFAGCEHVHGNLIINRNSTRRDAAIPISPSDLLMLSSIREIDGYLRIEQLESAEITDLRFLRQLEVIGGTETVVDEVFGWHYSLIIQDNSHLRTLNLASLRRVENGGIRIYTNPSLCLVDTIHLRGYLVNSSLVRAGGHSQDCSEVHCDGECLSGCWGTLPDECVMCRNYQFMDTCVSTCNTSVSYADEDSLQCLPLDMPSSNSSTTEDSPTTSTTLDLPSATTIPSDRPTTAPTTAPDPPTTDQPTIAPTTAQTTAPDPPTTVPETTIPDSPTTSMTTDSTTTEILTTEEVLTTDTPPNTTSLDTTTTPHSTDAPPNTATTDTTTAPANSLSTDATITPPNTADPHSTDAPPNTANSVTTDATTIPPSTADPQSTEMTHNPTTPTATELSNTIMPIAISLSLAGGISLLAALGILCLVVLVVVHQWQQRQSRKGVIHIFKNESFISA